MRKVLFLLTLVAAMVFACVGVVLAQSTNRPDNQQQPQDANKRYIVVLNEDVSDVPAVAEAHRQLGASPRHLYQSALKGYSATLPDQARDAIQRDPRVKFVDEDLPVQADQSSTATGGATGVDRIEGESNPATANDGSGVGAAVIDTGIDKDHTDLAPNVKYGINTIQPRIPNEDGQIIDRRVDCANPASSPDAPDDQGHGTHVAGTIGAKNNSAGVVGVAPGATLYAVKALDQNGAGFRSDIICGADWVTEHASTVTPNIKVANMSLGGSGSDDGKPCPPSDNPDDPNATTDAYKLALCNSTTRAGVTYVVSAGNDGGDLAKKVPAAYRDASNPLVLTVTALADYNGRPGGGASATCNNYGSDDTPASFSNFATTTADQNHTIAAPGTCILSTAIGNATATKSGTSMAAPHVAGTVALCLRSEGSCSGATTPADIINRLLTDAQARDKNDGAYGFSGDPTTSPTSGRYYSYLTYAGDYRSGGGTNPPPQTVLAAPTNLTATVGGSTKRPQVSLKWADNSNNENNFVVERSEDNGTTWKVLTSSLAANTTSYTDKTVVSGGKTYTYKIKATNGTESSAYSAPASATTK